MPMPAAPLDQTALITAAFLFTYLGMALGRVPGLRMDRTGIALFAVAVLLAFGATDADTIGAAQDAPTLLLPASTTFAPAASRWRMPGRARSWR